MEALEHGGTSRRVAGGQQGHGSETTDARTRRQISGMVQFNHNGVFSVQFRFQRAGRLAYRQPMRDSGDKGAN
jgi:hypothetical protein